MKVLERITLVVYSYVMLIVALLADVLIFGWLDVGIIEDLFEGWLAGGLITLLS